MNKFDIRTDEWVCTNSLEIEMRSLIVVYLEDIGLTKREGGTAWDCNNPILAHFKWLPSDNTPILDCYTQISGALREKLRKITAKQLLKEVKKIKDGKL